MAYVLTNGEYYIKMSRAGMIEKTNNIDEARIYMSMEKAKERLQKSPAKTKRYYILDIGTRSKYYISNGRIKFPKEVRELMYHNAKGRCVLCGRKIVYDDMTLDHVVPLAMGGHDQVENLQCVCEACNLFKGSILPDDFMERIKEIFLYQMEKKNSGKIKWRIVHRVLKRMI